MIHQSIHERSAVVSGRRVYDHALRLVHDNQVAVLVDYIERYVFRFRFERLHFGNIQLHGVAAFQLISRLRVFAVHCDLSAVRELFYKRPGFAAFLCQKPIQPNICIFALNRIYHSYSPFLFVGKPKVEHQQQRTAYHEYIRNVEHGEIYYAEIEEITHAV